MDSINEFEKKKISHCYQNFFIEEGKYFAFMRLYLPSLSLFSKVSELLERYEVEVRYGTFCTIERGTTSLKWTVFFTVKNENQVNEIRNEISKINGITPLTTFEEDIVLLAKGYGYSPEYPSIAYANLDESSQNVILMGGFWNRIVDRLDALSGTKVTDNILYQLGKSKADHMFHLIGRLNPMNPKDPNTIKNLFKGYGYCIIEITANNDGISEISVQDSFFKKRGRECNFLKGLFEAFFTKLYGNNHKFNETQCLGKGADYCRFERA